MNLEEYDNSILALMYAKFVIKAFLRDEAVSLTLQELSEQNTSVEDVLEELNGYLDHLRSYFDYIANTKDFYERQVAILTGITAIKRQVVAIEKQCANNTIIMPRMPFSNREEFAKAFNILDEEVTQLILHSKSSNRVGIKDRFIYYFGMFKLQFSQFFSKY